MRYLIAPLVGLHGLPHLVGFAVPFQLILSLNTPYKTTVLNGLIDVGHTGARVVGILWLLTALACVVAGSALWEGAAWSASFTISVLFCSLALCLTAMPEARIGVLVNGILLALFLTPRLASAWGLS